MTPGGMRAQASEEWHCPKSSITVSNEGPDTFRVNGCGQTALYRCARAQGQPPNTSPQSSLVDEAEYRHAQGDQTCTRLDRH